MGDKVSESITIDAAPKAVMAVIANLVDYPQWSEGVTGAEIITSHPDGAPKDVAMTIATPVGKDTYEIAYVWDGHASVSWTLNSDEQGRPKSSLMKALNGTYTLSKDGKGTKVVYELEIDPKIPMMGFMKRKAAATIADSALHGLKRHCER